MYFYLCILFTFSLCEYCRLFFFWASKLSTQISWPSWLEARYHITVLTSMLDIAPDYSNVLFPTNRPVLHLQRHDSPPPHHLLNLPRRQRHLYGPFIPPFCLEQYRRNQQIRLFWCDGASPVANACNRECYLREG